MNRILLALSLCMLGLPLSARADTAYGSLNNFDTVNDTGHECHGFEIEIEDIHSKDITYTYNYNHYGTPKITEDSIDPLHPRVNINYASGKNPDGSWAAFTAIPSGPITPTNGHQFTNPSVNFGGEHFGVGFYGVPGAVRYFWLIDDGAGNLIRGGEVHIGTPTFIVYPPVNNVPARVQAVIEPPEPVEVPVKEFGDPLWLKVTTTQSHNNNKVELRDLVSDDPDDPNDRNWKNGEPDEVEVEWQLLQTEFNQADGGANGEQIGNEEELPDGDEIITRRYDFFNYVGPIDGETGEARTDNVGPDDIHGVGIKEIDGVEVDLSTVVVVGDYIGAQMAGFDAAGQLSLLDLLQDGEINEPYVERAMVFFGTPPVVTTRTGDLPDGMEFDVVTGILSGTPAASGLFTFTLHSTDAAGADETVTYDLTVAEAAVPPHSAVTTSASPAEGGTTSGDGDYDNGTLVTVSAVANPGFQFLEWTESGTVVSVLSDYEFVIDMNRDLVAVFVPLYTVTTSAAPANGGTTSGDGDYIAGSEVTVEAIADVGFGFVNWTEGGVEVSASAVYDFAIGGDRALVANFESLPIFRNVGDLISVSESGKSTALDRRTRRLMSRSTVTVTNQSGETIEAPMNLIVTGLGAGVTMPEADGTTPAGNFYYDVQAKLGLVALAPGQSASITIKFVYPITTRISYRLEFWGMAP